MVLFDHTFICRRYVCIEAGEWALLPMLEYNICYVDVSLIALRRMRWFLAALWVYAWIAKVTLIRLRDIYTRFTPLISLSISFLHMMLCQPQALFSHYKRSAHFAYYFSRFVDGIAWHAPAPRHIFEHRRHQRECIWLLCDLRFNESATVFSFHFLSRHCRFLTGFIS